MSSPPPPAPSSRPPPSSSSTSKCAALPLTLPLLRDAPLVRRWRRLGARDGKGEGAALGSLRLSLDRMVGMARLLNKVDWEEAGRARACRNFTRLRPDDDRPDPCGDACVGVRVGVRVGVAAPWPCSLLW